MRKRGVIFIILLLGIFLLPFIFSSINVFLGTNVIDSLNSSNSSLTFDFKGVSNVTIDTIQLFGNWSGNWTANYTNTSYVNDTWLNISVLGFPEGNYIWGIYSNDSEGKESWSENRTFTIDRTSPAFDSLTNQTGFSNESFFYDVNATDNNSLDSFDLNDTSVFSINSTTGIITNSTSLAEGGFYVYNLSVNDSFGNFNWTIFTINITYVEIQYPIISIGENIINYFNSSNSSLTFDFKGVSNVTIDTIQLFGNWSGNWTANYTNTSYVNDTWLNISVLGFPEGNYIWGIYSNDSEGKESWSENRTFTIDRTSPTITVVSPTDNANYDDEDILFSVRTNEKSNCNYTLTVDGDSTNYSMTANGTQTGFTNSKDLDNDDYEVIFYCWDFSLNLVTSASIDFDVEVPEEEEETTSTTTTSSSTSTTSTTPTAEVEEEEEDEENESQIFSLTNNQSTGILASKENLSSKIKFRNPFFKNIKNSMIGNSMFSVEIDLEDLETDNLTKIVINYTIMDLEGNIYFKGSETTNPEEMKSYYRDFDVENLSKGKYVLEAEINNAGEIETIQSDFKVRPHLSFVIALIVGVFVLGGAFLFFFFNKFFQGMKNKKYLLFTRK